MRKQGAGEPKEAKRKKSRKKGWIILLILLILAAAAVPGWCGVQHYLGSKALEAGDYEDAIACFEKDFLFSDGWIEATIRSAGDAASAAGDYVTAQSWYARLDGGSDWADAVYEQALNTEDPQERIEILEQIAEEKRAQEQIGKAKLELAE